MKRKIFIGSSTEGLAIAKQVKLLLTDAFGDWLECDIWDEGNTFSLNRSFLESLIKASRRYDYGIFVATSDDFTFIRKLLKKTPRDNVIFEMGLFLGSLGLTRAFIFADKKCKLPSDYNGVTISTFSSKKIHKKDVESILIQIDSTKDTYSLKTIPSVALALGYFDNFIVPFAKGKFAEDFCLRIIIPKSLEDINTLIAAYKINNPSDEISVYNDGMRPRINRLKIDNLKYWDFPTTLSTLNKLIDLVLGSVEIGNNPEKQQWIEYELRNFKGSLEALIEQTSSCKGKVIVDWAL